MISKVFTSNWQKKSVTLVSKSPQFLVKRLFIPLAFYNVGELEAEYISSEWYITYAHYGNNFIKTVTVQLQLMHMGKNLSTFVHLSGILSNVLFPKLM